MNTGQTHWNKAVTKGRGKGDFPWLLWAWALPTLIRKKWKMEPKELPCWTFPVLQIVYTCLATWNLVTALLETRNNKCYTKIKWSKVLKRKIKGNFQQLPENFLSSPCTILNMPCSLQVGIAKIKTRKNMWDKLMSKLENSDHRLLEILLFYCGLNLAPQQFKA